MHRDGHGSSISKPWYLSIQETRYSALEDARKHIIAQQLRTNHRWGREIKETVANIGLRNEQRRQSKQTIMAQVTGSLDKKREHRMLELEAIAGVASHKERAKLNKTKQMSLIRRDLKKMEVGKKKMSAENLRAEFQRKLTVQSALKSQLLDMPSSHQDPVWMSSHGSGDSEIKRKVDPETIETRTFVLSRLLLQHLGENLTKSANMIVKLDEETIKHSMGLPTKKVTSASSQADAIRVMPQLGMQLNVDRMLIPDYLDIVNGKMTLQHTDLPSSRPRWAYINTTRGFETIQRERGNDEWSVILSALNDVFDNGGLLHCLERAFLTLDTLNESNIDLQRKKRVTMTQELARQARQPLSHRVRYLQECLNDRLPQFAGKFKDLMSAERTGTAKLRDLVQRIILQLGKQASSVGSFYLELHSHSRGNQWVFGLSPQRADKLDLNRQVDVDPPLVVSTSSSSDMNAYENEDADKKKHVPLINLALYCDGGTVDNGRRLPALASGIQNLREITVLGIIVDVHSGIIKVRADGAANFFTVFGVGAVAFNEAEQEQQRASICSGKCVPFFGLLGPQPRKKPVDEAKQHSKHIQSLLLGNANEDEEHLERLEYENGTKTYVTPELSLNFGSHPFFNCPNYVAPANSLSLVETEREYQSILSTVDVTALEQHMHANKAKKHLTLADLGDIDDEVAREAIHRRRVQQINSMNSKLVSWSKFPPMDIQLHQAVMTLQKHFRRWLARRNRRRMYLEMNYASRLIQKRWRQVVRRRRDVKISAVLPIQAIVRGFLLRRSKERITLLGYEFSAETHAAATKIQCWWRMVLAQRMAQVMAAVLIDKIEFVKTYVVMLQRMFRARRQRQQRLVSKSQIQSIMIVQKLFRGVRLRRKMMKIDPHRFKQIHRIQKQMKHRQDRDGKATKIQAAWRGYVARKRTRLLKYQTKRDMEMIVNMWRAHRVREKVGQHFNKPPEYRAALMKTFFSALLNPNVVLEDKKDTQTARTERRTKGYFDAGNQKTPAHSRGPSKGHLKKASMDLSSGGKLNGEEEEEEELEDEREIDRLRAIGALDL